MLTHEQVWRGIDKLALHNELSASGLARKAGLDPTTFNKSKRRTKEGKLRWPSTESISKILEATQSTMSEFVRLIEGETGDVEKGAASSRLPLVGFADLEDSRHTDVSGFPVGDDWEEIDISLADHENAYVVELDSDLAAPAYRAGDNLVVSPVSGIRRGDRVLVRKRDGEVSVGSLVRSTAQRVTIQPVSDAPDEVIEIGDLAWMVRILWVSQ